MKEPVDYLVLAPHATLPGHDGASVRSNELAKGWFSIGRSVVYVAKHETVVDAGRMEFDGVPGPERSKNLSALTALCRRVSYNAGKHVTRSWTVRARRALETFQPKVVYVHFLWTIPTVLKWIPSGCRLVVDTHNFDPEWFGNMEKGAANPVVRYLARSSASYSLRALGLLPQGTLLAHVSERDAERYRALAPALDHQVVINGCRLKPRATQPVYEGRRRLYFLGLLSAKMNEDALTFFSETVWPALRERAEVTVLGKAPGAKVRQLCLDNGWTLIPDVSDRELDERVAGMHFAILPFAYNAGSKTKLMDAAGRGIPLLTTRVGAEGFGELPQGVHLAETTADWLRILGDSMSDIDSQVEALLAFAKQHTWKGLAAQVDTKALPVLKNGTKLP